MGADVENALAHVVLLGFLPAGAQVVQDVLVGAGERAGGGFGLVRRLSSQPEDLADASHVAAVQAARVLEVITRRSTYGPARGA
ncbi:hypothetical protein Slala02_64530 [Streptomyces lavendulae subsp. lavendulae]|nr:hypothetical protein Slala01_68150 [Streptomyces lavendulae subsp. lavendulae]GLX30633.1 hypothetical protein Slala02_64530 [Streptomyces lavendulae subsp. lavendulae]